MTELEEDGVYVCGTARKDRKGFPEQLKKVNLKNRYRIHNSSEGQSVGVSLARPEGSFTAMATNCQPDYSGTVLRRTQDGSWIPVPCPQSIIMYDTYMGGVDRGNQLRG